jgi:hypothetical protein
MKIVIVFFNNNFRCDIMSENWSKNQRQTSQSYSGIGNLCMPPSSVTGSNRSRRPSWSDAKVLKMIFLFSS